MARDYVRKNTKSASRRNEPEGGRNWRWPLAGIMLVLFVAGIFYLKQQSNKIAAEQGDDSGSIIQQTMKTNTPETATGNAAGKTSTNKTATQTTEANSSSPPQPKFDFYTMLPKGQTANTAAAAPPPPATVMPAATPAPMPVTQTAPATPGSVKDNNAVKKAAVAAPPPAAKQQPPVTTKQAQNTVQTDASDLIAVEIQKLGADKTSKAKPEINTAKTANYILQVGVFKNYNDADQLKAQLVLQGFEVSIKSYRKQTNTLYRVFMGPYPSLAAAKKQQHVLDANQIKNKITKE